MGVRMVVGPRVVAFLWVITLASVAFYGCGKSPDVMYREGKALVGKPETQAEGMTALEKFVKKFPKDSRAPEVMLAIANIHLNAKQFPEAEAAYARLLEKYPKSIEAYNGLFLLGYMYYDGMNDSVKARETLNKFIAAYPDSGLTTSAKVLLENIGVPVEQWGAVKDIMADQNTEIKK